MAVGGLTGTLRGSGLVKVSLGVPLYLHMEFLDGADPTVSHEGPCNSRSPDPDLDQGEE